MKLLPGFLIFGGICGAAAGYVTARLSLPFVEGGPLDVGDPRRWPFGRGVGERGLRVATA